MDILLLIVGLGLILAGANFLTDGSAAVAQRLRVPYPLPLCDGEVCPGVPGPDRQRRRTHGCLLEQIILIQFVLPFLGKNVV